LLGSLAYMSPEQLRNPHAVDARADVYAFGVILYEMMAGELPFQGASHSALIVAIASIEPKRLSQLRPNFPAGLEAVVLRALAREPADRYPDIAALIDALLPFATSRTSAAALGFVAAAPGSRASAPATSSAGRNQAEGAVLPAPMIHDSVTVLPRTRLFRSRRQLALVALSLLGVLAFWAWTNAAPPSQPAAVKRPNPPAPAAHPPAAAVAAEASARPKPSNDAPVPPASAVALEAKPTPTSDKPVKAARVRTARKPAPAGPGKARAKTNPDSDEDSLFSGRK
jgi:serine/threonine-protein kinase